MSGKVFLVGAGPGDPELLTVKAARLLQTADVILHDALVPPAILELAPASAKIMNVGKRCGRKHITQEQINRQLIEFASAEKFVVRLKSGDPLIFGRAGEEMQALREAGIEVEVVPGITSAVAAAAAARIPLTDRRHADQVLFLSGHCAEGKESIPWNAAISDRTTIVVYMPGDYCRVAEKLIAGGLSREMPCLIVSKTSSPEQEIRETTLDRVSKVSHFDSPSLLILGDVVRSNSLSDGGSIRCAQPTSPFGASSANIESEPALGCSPEQ